MHLTLIARVPLDPSLVLQIPERRVEREFPEHSAATSRVVDGHIAVALAGVAAIDVGKGTLTVRHLDGESTEFAPPERAKSSSAISEGSGRRRPSRSRTCASSRSAAYLREFSFGRGE
jgi:hypothetical protein